MHHYLEFMDECERLKDLFLLEAEDDSEGGDDLAEMEPEDSGDDSKEESGETSGETSDDSSDDSSDESSDDGLDGDTDLDLDSDLGDITGDDSLEPEADEVNAEEKPGAVNPETLYQEVTQGEDNIYDRTAKAALEKFPGGKCAVKDMLPIIAIGLKSYMKNKNYAALPKIDMKKLVYRIAHDIHDKLSGKKKEGAAKPAAESVYYAGMAPTLMEGWKELALAGAIAAAPMANAATAESAPRATLRHLDDPATYVPQGYNSAYDDLDEQTGPKQDSAKQAKKAAPEKYEQVPHTPDYSKVDLDSSTTYQITPEQYSKMKDTGTLPAKYVVDDSDPEAAPGDAGKPAPKAAKASKKTAGNSGAVSQKAAKAQAGSQVKRGGERCAAPATEKKSGDLGTAIHKLGHSAVDLGIAGAKTAWGGIKGAVGGLIRGTVDAAKEANADLKRDHDKMISERGK